MLKPYVVYGLHYSVEVTCSIWSHVQHGDCMQCMGSMQCGTHRQWVDGHSRGPGTCECACTAPPALHTSPTDTDPNPGWGQHNPSIHYPPVPRAGATGTPHAGTALRPNTAPALERGGKVGGLGLVGLTWSPELDALLVVGHAHAVVTVSLAVSAGRAIQQVHIGWAVG